MDGYLLVEEDTLERAVELSKSHRYYIERELLQAKFAACALVMFEHDGKLVTMRIHKQYDPEFVMKIKFDLEPI